MRALSNDQEFARLKKLKIIKKIIKRNKISNRTSNSFKN